MMARRSFLSSLTRWEFTYETTLPGPPDRAFEVLTDLYSYPQWNPFVRSASGQAVVGGIVKGKVQMGRFLLSYKHHIFECVSGKSFCWQEFGFFTWLEYGRRSRYLKESDGNTEYRCHLLVTGLMAGLAGLLLGGALRSGIIAEAEALKRRVAEEPERLPVPDIRQTSEEGDGKIA